MGANYGEYSSFQLDVMCGVAQGKSYEQIAHDLHKFKDEEEKEPDGSSTKGAIYESLDLRRNRGFRNRLDLIHDAFRRGQLTREQLAPGYNTDVVLSAGEKDLLGFINETAHFSDEAIGHHYTGLLGHISKRRVKVLRAQIGGKLFGHDVPFLTSAVGYFVNTYDPHISIFTQGASHSLEKERKNPIQADPPILFAPQGAEIGKALRRIRQEQEAAIIIDLISQDDRKQRNFYPRPQILAVGGEDLAELLYELSERTDDTTYKGFLHEAVQMVSSDGISASVSYIEKETAEGVWRLYLVGKHLDQIQRELLGIYEDRLEQEKDKGSLRRQQRISL